MITASELTVAIAIVLQASPVLRPLWRKATASCGDCLAATSALLCRCVLSCLFVSLCCISFHQILARCV